MTEIDYADTREWDGYTVHAKFLNTEGSGPIEITANLPEFFPCSSTELKRLLKSLRRDVDLDRMKRNAGAIASWIESAILDTENRQKGEAELWVHYETKVSELKDSIKDGKGANGVPLDPETKKALEKTLKDLKWYLAEHKHAYNVCAATIRKLKANMETLQAFDWGID